MMIKGDLMKRLLLTTIITLVSSCTYILIKPSATNNRIMLTDEHKCEMLGGFYTEEIHGSKVRVITGSCDNTHIQ